MVPVQNDGVVIDGGIENITKDRGQHLDGRHKREQGTCEVERENGKVLTKMFINSCWYNVQLSVIIKSYFWHLCVHIYLGLHDQQFLT